MPARRLTVTRAKLRGNGVSLVDSTLDQSNGEPLAIQWEVHNGGQGPAHRRRQGRGVSMVVTRRAEYNSYIRLTAARSNR